MTSARTLRAAALAMGAARRPRRDEEHNEQVVLFLRIRSLAINDPRYAPAADRTYAIPNGGGRSKREGARLKAEGVRAGVSDVFCSIPSAGKHGLYIELKKRERSYATDEQKKWIASSLEQGYAAHVCRGADAAFAAWREYVQASFA